MDPTHAIDAFFGAAFEPDGWTAALDQVARAVGAEGATLVFGSSTPDSVAASPSMLPFVHAYFEQRHYDDPRESRVQPTIAGGFQTDFDVFTPAEIQRDGFYQEFLRPIGFGWHGVALLSERPAQTVLSLKRSLLRGPFERDEIERLDRALPYLRAATTAAVVAQGALVRTQLGSLAQLGQGAATIDRHGRLLDSNDAVPLGDGLRFVDGVPCAGHRGDQAALDAAIARALRRERPSQLPPPRRVILRQQFARWPLLVDVLPLVDRSEQSLFDATCIMVITDPNRGVSPDAGDLRAIFGLTSKETELAVRLAGGMALDEAASALRITRAHARQRLKLIFMKTDTHRQGELIALLARLRRHRM